MESPEVFESVVVKEEPCLAEQAIDQPKYNFKEQYTIKYLDHCSEDYSEQQNVDIKEYYHDNDASDSSPAIYLSKPQDDNRGTYNGMEFDFTADSGSGNAKKKIDGKKYTSLTMKQKLQILAEVKQKTKNELCANYGCSLPTLNRIIRNQKDITGKFNRCQLSAKRDRSGACKEVESALKIWLDQMRTSGAAISSPAILEKAKQFALNLNKSFNPTTGWLWRWKKREGILFGNEYNKKSSTNVENKDDFKNTILPGLISGYEQTDIFSADESGLFFKALPTQELITGDCSFNNLKLSKERLTLLFICNSTGDYKKLITIGKSANPRCFNNSVIPLKYYHNQKAWMTQKIWTDILQSLDEEMLALNRKIILFVNNASCHQNFVTLRNVNVQFIPSNMNALFQPLDQGIICSFKTNYRQTIIRKQIAALEQGRSADQFAKSISILDAMHIAKYSWWLVEPKSIQNCFKKANFIPIYQEAQAHENVNNDIMESIFSYNGKSQKAFEDYVRIDDKLLCCGELTEAEIVNTILPTESSSEEEEAAEEKVIPESSSISELLHCIQSLRLHFLPENKFYNELENMEKDIVAKKLKQEMQLYLKQNNG